MRERERGGGRLGLKEVITACNKKQYNHNSKIVERERGEKEQYNSSTVVILREQLKINTSSLIPDSKLKSGDWRESEFALSRFFLFFLFILIL